MILDSKLEFCDNVDVSSTAGTSLVGDVIDLDNDGRALGATQNISAYVNVSEAFVGSGATVVFILASDAGAAISTTTATEHFRSMAYTMAELALGAQLHFRLPGGAVNAERYLGLLVVTAGATTTAGSINSGLILDAQDWVATADAEN